MLVAFVRITLSVFLCIGNGAAWTLRRQLRMNWVIILDWIMIHSAANVIITVASWIPCKMIIIQPHIGQVAASKACVRWWAVWDSNVWRMFQRIVREKDILTILFKFIPKNIEHILFNRNLCLNINKSKVKNELFGAAGQHHRESSNRSEQ